LRRILYSRWDGSQPLYSLEADQALDALSKLMMEGLSAQEALDWMREGGFNLAGLDFRVMGTEELIAELRERARELMQRFNLDHAFDERWEKLREALRREEGAVAEQQGVESKRWNDFKRREDRMPRRLSEALERFRDYSWSDPEAEAAYRELLEEQEEMRELEEFAARNRANLRGAESLDYEQARELMRQVQALSQMVRDLLEGNFEQLSPEELRELLGENAAQSLILLRDLRSSMERAGYLRQGDGGVELTPRAMRKLGEMALEDIYGRLTRGEVGSHETRHRGAGVVCTERSQPYEFGRPAHLDALGTLRNALRRSGPSAAEQGKLEIAPNDLEVFDTDQLTETTTVLLLDMSWSMSWQGRWPAAKRVAVAMDHLIRTRYPRDRFFIVGFYTSARELRVHELPELVWNMSDPFTNLQDGLRMAQRLIERHPNPNRQIIVITDGQPTAYFMGGELHVEWPNGRGGISPNANRETLNEVRRVTKKEITINTFMLDNSPELLRFVEAMTRINRGRAFYTTPDTIGEYVMVDYLDRKRKRVR
jgi:uncharacterized protein with von Willebrand factor type A (vWA) domain